MMLRIFDYEFYFRYDTQQWAQVEKPHSWSWSVEIMWLSPEEKKHREDWQKYNPGKKYPTY